MKNKIKFSIGLLIVFSLAIQNSVAQDDVLFRRHVIQSGYNGLYYGVALDIIAELDGAAAAGIPVITAGGGALIPLLFAERSIDYDALVLNMHGKSIGWAHGMSLGLLTMGDSAFADGSNQYKITVGLGALTSIGLGILGSSLARNNDWTEGRVELYRHYGTFVPFTVLHALFAFSEEPRLYGGAILLSGIGGYLLADQVNKWNDYTRGEMRATQVLTVLNIGLGYGIFADIASDNFMDEFNDPLWLIPAAGAVTGTIAGHLWLKGTNLTPQQGMLAGLAAGGGALIGLGVALLIDSDELAPWYLFPYGMGLAAYSFVVERSRSRNLAQNILPIKHKSNFEIAFMPQNLVLNNKIQNNNFMVNGRTTRMQPLFSASLRF